MCQRKIITEKKEWTVPLLNGCACPMIKEFHHVHETDPVAIQNKPPRRVYSLPNYCYDIHTTIPIEDVPDHHIVFRNCICKHFTGLCMVLPPLLYQMNEEEIISEIDDNFEDEYDDDDDNFNTPGGNMGIRPL